MKYREIEFTITQGFGQRMWEWSTTTVAGVMVMGRAHSDAAAVAAAEKAIDKVLAGEKVRLVPSENSS